MRCLFGETVYGICVCDALKQSYSADAHRGQSLTNTQNTPHAQVFIDTTGWAFTYPAAAAAGARVAAYTHYPTVSTNMISRLWQRNVDFSNSATIAGGLAGLPCVSAYLPAGSVRT